MPNPWTRAGAAAAALAIAVATLTPLPSQAASAAAEPWYCLVCGATGTVDVLQNVLLFLPLGFFLAALGVRARYVVLACAVASTSIELTQALAIPGRDGSLSDVLTNTLGGGLGAGLEHLLPVLLAPAPRVARRLGGLAALGWLGLLATAAWGLAPAPPAVGTYDVRWAPWDPVNAWFPGRVVALKIGGTDYRPGLTPSAPVDRALRSRTVAVSARIVPRWATSGYAPIADLVDPDRHPALRLAQRHRDLIFHVRTHAEAARLRNPGVTLRGVLPRRWQRDTATVRGWVAGPVLGAALSGLGARARETTLRLAPSGGWRLLAFSTLPPGGPAAFLDGLWVAAPLVLAGFWWGRARRGIGPSGCDRGTIAGAAALLLVAGLGVLPLVSGYGEEKWPAWLGAAAGLGVGWLVGRYAPVPTRADSPPRARRVPSP